ncbi:MAG: saccharopine dehydrogenase NADP-binding domain-containing protein, partial [Pseudomonadales bacterium]|nr:saccharopine dehydrogenase NADP-binding domain-containing protein [Pseudomonadales bacterium]
MSNDRKVLIYGASGYTGKLVAESLARRNIPFYMAGRTRTRLEAALKVVEERRGAAVDAEIAVAGNTAEELLPLFEQVDVVINVAGPFMQVGWPIVKAALDAGCHYLDTTGEQDWTMAVRDQYGNAFAEKGLLLNPANSYMWAAGAIAAEIVLETGGVDSLDILYQVDHGLPSEASTQSFLRMVCNDTSQYYLELNELKAWPNDQKVLVTSPHRNAVMGAHPWGGACEPIWFQHDPRVRNCKVLTAIGEHMIDGVIQAIKAFNAQAAHLPQAEREAWTNEMGRQMASGEPPKDDIDVQRGVIVCHGQGRQVTTSLVMNVSAPYTFTGDICADSAQRL